MQIKFFKKALMILLVLSVFWSKIFSQTYTNEPSSILSFTAGLTSTRLIHDSSSFKSGILFNGGFNYSLMLNDKFNASVEILYTGKAIKQNSPIIKYRYFFIELPLFLQIKLGENIRMNAGGQYSIATNSQMITLDSSKPNGVDVNKIKNTKPTDYSFLLGAELDISKSISIGTRYTFSGSVLFQKNQINFGVFQLSIKYSPIKTYKVFFHQKDAK